MNQRLKRKLRVRLSVFVSLACILIGTSVFMYRNAQANIASIPELAEVVLKRYDQFAHNSEVDVTEFDALKREARAIYGFSRKLQEADNYMREAHLIENLSTRLMKASFEEDKDICLSILSDLGAVISNDDSLVSEIIQ